AIRNTEKLPASAIRPCGVRQSGGRTVSPTRLTASTAAASGQYAHGYTAPNANAPHANAKTSSASAHTAIRGVERWAPVARGAGRETAKGCAGNWTMVTAGRAERSWRDGRTRGAQSRSQAPPNQAPWVCRL